MQIYRAISEGIINLADCFFDMEYTDAQRGLDIYKQHTLDNDKLGVRPCLLPVSLGRQGPCVYTSPF
jgi:ANTH domain